MTAWVDNGGLAVIWSTTLYRYIRDLNTYVVPCSSFLGVTQWQGLTLKIHCSGSNLKPMLTRYISAVRQYTTLDEFLSGEGWENGAPYLGSMEETEKIIGLEKLRLQPIICVVEITHFDDV